VSGLGRLPIVGQPNPDEPRDVHLVGRYAIGATWADDHGSIYPFDRLRQDCPCGACAAGGPTPTMAWPEEIRRLATSLRVRWSDGHESLYPYATLRSLCRCAVCAGTHS
jgi:DUF971 family protein